MNRHIIALIPHDHENCPNKEQEEPEHVDYVENPPLDTNAYGRTYNSSWRTHPHLSWRNNNSGQNRRNYQQPPRQNITLTAPRQSTSSDTATVESDLRNMMHDKIKKF